MKLFARGNAAAVGDAERDLRRLFAAIHHYLAAQARPADTSELATAYAQLVDEHNAIWARYIRRDEAASTVAGIEFERQILEDKDRAIRIARSDGS